MEITQALVLDQAGISGGDTKAYSRTKEMEADKVGLVLSVIAGYNGNEAAAVWERMASLGGDGPEFLSTHPSSSRRANYLRKELPAAQRVAAKINNGIPAWEFVEKVYAAGGDLLISLANATDIETSPDGYHEYLLGANLFFLMPVSFVNETWQLFQRILSILCLELNSDIRLQSVTLI